MSGQQDQNLSGGPRRIPAHEPDHFDFEGWSQLAQQNPAGYFEARRLAIESFISAAPGHVAGGLRRLQGRIDNLRACAGSPLSAVGQINGLMLEHLDLLGHQLDVLKEETERLRGRSGGGISRR